MQTTNTLFPVISDESVERIDLSPGETIFSGYSDIMETFISFKDSGGIELIGQQENLPLTYSRITKRASSFLSVHSWWTSNGDCRR